MSAELNGVEVIVIQDCTFNGPDHRTLGHLFAGDHVLTHESYVDHLLKAGLVCMPSEFANLDKLAAETDLANIDAEIERLIQEQERLALEAKEGEAEAEVTAAFAEETEPVVEPVVAVAPKAPAKPKARGK